MFYLKSNLKNIFLLGFAIHSPVWAVGGQSPVNKITITRQPYLQLLGQNTITIRWRTSLSEVGVVRYGLKPDVLDKQQKESASTTEHEVKLTSLLPGTKYFYSIEGAGGKELLTADVNQYFVTAPLGSKSTRIWVIGDAGTANSDQKAVRDAYYQLEKKENKATDFWMMLGDNAYQVGSDSDYQKAVFEIYPDMLKKSALFSTRGNHESSTANGQAVYYNIFSLPTTNELGGLASGTEAYYSFDYGDAHFVCLDSEGTSRSKTGAMASWLKADLANTSKKWIIAFWHHPPYTKGSHDSDTELQLVEMRENFLPILESGGVDLVLSGHSHSYERSFFINGHYGKSTTFNSSHQVSAGSGRINQGGAYTKVPGQKKGAVYTVAGSSGKISGGELNYKAMFLSLKKLGSLVLDVDSNEINLRFLRENGAIDDYFTISKATPQTNPK